MLGIMLGAAGPEVRARRPIAPRSTGIRRLHTAHRGGYGAPGIRAALRAGGYRASRGRVERRMRRQGIRAVTPRRFLACTTGSHYDLPIAANRLGQKFAAGRPNQVWLGLHPLRASLRRVALSAAALDLHTREIAGWAMRCHMRAELAIAARSNQSLSRKGTGSLLAPGLGDVARQNAATEEWSSGQAEGQINRLKTLKRAMYGRASVELLRARMLPLELSCEHGE